MTAHDPPHALLSVADKTGLVPFAESLADLGFRLVATGGTGERLREAGLDVRSVADVTGSPELFEGRVKTLHPAIHGGILARRGPDTEARRDRDIPRIDLVAVNFYPFDAAAADASRTNDNSDEVREQIDIGGPTLVRSAAKNAASVWPVVEPDDYEAVVEALSGESPEEETELRERLAARALRRAARYDAAVADWRGDRVGGDDALLESFALGLERTASLRYGENPHQSGALYRPGTEPHWGGVDKLHGKELSYNNLVDLDAAVGLTLEFDRPAVAIVKHTNPAGCAMADDPADAWESALACDPMSSFGGIVAANRPIDEPAADAIDDKYVEAVAAPGFEEAALEILTQKSALRLLELPADLSVPSRQLRPTVFGTVAQTTDPPVGLDRDEVDVPTERPPTDAEWEALRFNWRVVKHVKSNAIVVGREDRTLGVGAGQMSRVDAVDLATRKSNHPLDGSVLASDAFFPFRDGVDHAAEAGVSAVVQPGGSKNDDEVVEACDEHGVAMVLTGERHFRH